MQIPKLRDKRTSPNNAPYPLGLIPDELIITIAKHLVYLVALGQKDISGEQWGDIFAKAVGGKHLNSPLGLADIVLGKMAWSAKSVKNEQPHSCQTVRVISGRCSPDYSYGITDPHEDIQRTGTAVLGIWNERINIAKDQFEPLRSILLIRNTQKMQFCLYECDLHRYNTAQYKWQQNKNGNLIGIDLDTGKHIFTWQPHGSQFTIKYDLTKSMRTFSVQKPQVLDFAKTIAQIGFNSDWVLFDA